MVRPFHTFIAVFGATVVLALSGCSTVDQVFGDDREEPKRDPSGNVTASSDNADVFSLRVGDCISSFQEGEVNSISIMPCEDPHEMEIFARFELEDGDYPGAETASQLANDGCVAEFESFIGIPYNESELFVSYLHPTEETWEQQGDREVLCTVYELGDNDKPVETTGSLKGSSR